MDLGIEGKAALVVAGSRGLGRATADALAAEGVRVLLSSRNEESLAQARASLRALGAEVETRADDITDAQRRLLFRLAARLGFEGEAARSYVDRRLGSPKDRRAASRLIDELQEEAKRDIGAGHAGAA